MLLRQAVDVLLLIMHSFWREVHQQRLLFNCSDCIPLGTDFALSIYELKRMLVFQQSGFQCFEIVFNSFQRQFLTCSVAQCFDLSTFFVAMIKILEAHMVVKQNFVRNPCSTFCLIAGWLKRTQTAEVIISPLLWWICSLSNLVCRIWTSFSELMVGNTVKSWA